MPRRTKQEMALVIDSMFDAIKRLKQFHPITVRQLFYQLVKDGIIENSESEYRMVSRKTTELRNMGKMSYSVFEDRSRRTIQTLRWSDVADFYRDKLNGWNYYKRCLIQQQDNYVEVWTEKDALTSFFERTCMCYCLPIVVCRGQQSTTYIHEYRQRAEAAIKRKQTPVILYFGDLDPTGVQIPISIENRLAGLNVNVHRWALTPTQVKQYNLPDDTTAFKDKDPNAVRFLARFGRIAVELDALSPADLMFEIREGIKHYLDMDTVDAELEVEKEEIAMIADTRKAIITLLESRGIAL